ncbi:hypothetical protein AGABI2DRAFT_144938 [Agaricus bisporus var. bisporus H97]|uniref:hypothetical protein n=1 Tax=Agaricus bisporus var. bisporus (strain H97 / ATCC MYA-4626 / FGSC 10389) TaxID=936046 RepID=UPI00029F766F|nr:hypothetical protein AGABI2DRAFT_144938 [Agaricus bisporus var. bisporus H97]EKV44365.1 hypothetical protein AGABI2DRAFT_144938 [Agaricus bisporus var. bisporus H97]
MYFTRDEIYQQAPLCVCIKAMFEVDGKRKIVNPWLVELSEFGWLIGNAPENRVTSESEHYRNPHVYSDDGGNWAFPSWLVHLINEARGHEAEGFIRYGRCWNSSLFLYGDKTIEEII